MTKQSRMRMDGLLRRPCLLAVTNKALSMLAMTLALFLLFSAPAMAACSNPAGYGGDMNYNTSQSEMQYCDGTDWISMGAGPGTGGGCANPAGGAGDMNYNTTYHVAQYCNGNEWVAMGPSGDDATGAPRAGLAGHWKLDETSGTFADSSGNGNTGTQFGGIEYASAGVIGASAGFDGADDYLLVSSPASVDLGTGSFTISFWFKSSFQQADGVYGLFLKGSGPYNNGGTGIECRYNLDPNLWISCVRHDDTVGAQNRLHFLQAQPVSNYSNKWLHIVMVYDAALGYSTAYLNGVDAGLGTAASTGSYTNSYDVRLGRSHDDGYGLGVIDDLRIYNRPLSASEVQALYDASSYNAGLVGWWKLDDGAGTSAADASGNGNNGTLTNMAGTEWTSGLKNGALSFDGVNDYVNVGNMDIDAAATISAWVKIDSNSTIGNAILGKNFNTFQLYHSVSTGKLQFQTNAGAGCNGSSSGTVPYDEWVHVALTWDTTTGATFFINGASSGILGGSCANEISNNNGIFVSIGATSLGAGYNMQGQIDDVRLYNRSLSSTEIQRLYGCTGPYDTEGTMQYNPSYRTMQYCNGYNWVGVGKVVPSTADCPNIGDVCNDGSVYAGLSPDGNVRMFTTPADGGTFAWNSGNATGKVTTGVTDTTTGEANSNSLMTIDSDSATSGTQLHLAAQHCMNLTAHGHTDWYLPAESEAGVLYTNRAAIGGFNTSGAYPAGYYWTSTEVNQNVARTKWFSGGTNGGSGKEQSGHAVRCVRK